MSRKIDELRFLVRASYAAGRSPLDTVELVRRHLAFLEAGDVHRKPPHLELVTSISN